MLLEIFELLVVTLREGRPLEQHRRGRPLQSPVGKEQIEMMLL
jgi:hypothetical protein